VVLADPLLVPAFLLVEGRLSPTGPAAAIPLVEVEMLAFVGWVVWRRRRRVTRTKHPRELT